MHPAISIPLSQSAGADLRYNELMYTARNADVVEDLEFAIDVLEESSHLGLDSEFASRLRAVALRQIERRRATARPPVPAPAPTTETVMA